MIILKKNKNYKEISHEVGNLDDMLLDIYLEDLERILGVPCPDDLIRRTQYAVFRDIRKMAPEIPAARIDMAECYGVSCHLHFLAYMAVCKLKSIKIPAEGRELVYSFSDLTGLLEGFMHQQGELLVPQRRDVESRAVYRHRIWCFTHDRLRSILWELVDSMMEDDEE